MGFPSLKAQALRSFANPAGFWSVCVFPTFQCVLHMCCICVCRCCAFLGRGDGCGSKILKLWCFAPQAASPWFPRGRHAGAGEGHRRLQKPCAASLPGDGSGQLLVLGGGGTLSTTTNGRGVPSGPVEVFFPIGDPPHVIRFFQCSRA